jgi:hypothetical protein
MVRHIVLVIATVVLLAGCNSAAPEVDGEPVASPSSGPMTLPLVTADDATVMEKSGAAGLALECDGRPYRGDGGSYDTGLASVQSTAERALANYLREEGLRFVVPTEGYRIEREDDNRVLFSYDVGARTKIAFIVANTVRDYADDVGWGVESWAQCDPAELPDNVTEALNIGVWQDRSGARVPVTKIQSFTGSEHCNWENITFIHIGPGDAPDQYLRDTTGELAEFLQTTYDAQAVLPADATDSGFRRDGRQLWLASNPDAAYLVSLDDADDIERWPVAKEPVWCA